jgi:hypothetical protein
MCSGYGRGCKSKTIKSVSNAPSEETNAKSIGKVDSYETVVDNLSSELINRLGGLKDTLNQAHVLRSNQAAVGLGPVRYLGASDRNVSSPPRSCAP